MAFKLTIGGRDYSPFVYNDNQQLTMTYTLNKPQQLTFAVLSEDQAFGGLGIPKREEQIVLDTIKWNPRTFVGYISAYPVMTLAGYNEVTGFTASRTSNISLFVSGAQWKTNQWANYVVNLADGQSRTVLYNTATDLILQKPFNPIPQAGTRATLSTPIFSQKIVCASEEYQLNVKSAQLTLLPSLAGRRTGAIIRIMTEFLLPGKFKYNFGDNAGDYQADFEIKAGDVWSDLVGKCATNDRGHYEVFDGTIYYDRFGDEALGFTYDVSTDATVTGWNAANMQVNPAANPIMNDIIVIGTDCPRGMGKAFYVGDGFQGNFNLQAQAFGIENNTLVNEDWQNGLNAGTWELEGTGFDFSMGNLQIEGGDGYDSSYIRLLKGLELSGSLRLIHGEFQFGGPSEGIIGGLHQDFQDTNINNIICGFHFFKNIVPGESFFQTSIEAWVNGAAAGQVITTQDNHSYVLVTQIHYREIYPWMNLFGSISSRATYGGTMKKTKVFLSFEVWDYNITDVNTANPPIDIEPTVTKIYEDTIDLPGSVDNPFLAYTLVQAEDCNFAINFTQLSYPFQVLLETKKPVLDEDVTDPDDDTVVISKGTLAPVDWNELEVRSVGYGIDRSDATVTSDPTGHVLQFYPSPPENLPVPGELMEIWFRVHGNSLGRVQDPTSIAAMKALYGDPDDGTRTQVVSNFSPLPRTDEDARNAAAAILGDSVNPTYSVTYKVFSDYFTAIRPIPGRFLPVNEVRFEEATELLVSSVIFEMYGDHFTQQDKHFVTLQSGTQMNVDVMAELLNRKGPRVATTDVSSTDTILITDILSKYLPYDINDWGIQPYDVDKYEIGVVDPAIIADISIEIRKWDRGWGQITNGIDPGLILRTNPGQFFFTIPRTRRDQLFYMRFVNNGVYSARSAYCKVGWPLIPPPVVEVTATYVASASTLSVVFNIPDANFQDIWRVVVYATTDEHQPEDQDPKPVLLQTLIWDATSFKVTLTFKSENPDWVRLYSFNLLGERSTAVNVQVVPGGSDAGSSEVQVVDVVT